ncbi:hypothetical protein JJL45_02780 [Tamlana sp. s12]|uniref:hypothetical protein n=1 Tax=Tamlana sp. s12 TaxID=1630406 RepID=UPI000801FB96|nr:hypothetical protein [Tamlana sp. s12]OBQ51994.1 hypothetical protein VQ01_14780 [Tamlana sp. s12]QQY82934.1 hypothetical protein JJL45_02780 [Tamlana sp. s12]
MTKFKYLFLAICCLALTQCKTEEDHEYPINKRYWDVDDYDKAILELRFGYENDEKKPTFSNPEGRVVVEKLTDQQNFLVVLRDNELGLKHRNDVASEFFKHWQDMQQIYTATDRKDKYVYDMEMLAVWQYGLGLQLDYFSLGNEQIKESADDPNSTSLKRRVDSNIKILINNYIIYLDEINDEKSFSEAGKAKLAEGIDVYFSKLIALYPNGDYSGMKKKAELMLNKSESKEIKSSLNKLIALIDSKKNQELN